MIGWTLRASSAVLFILSLHIESSPHVESNFFNSTPTNSLFYLYFYYFILTFFSLSLFFFSSSFLHQVANPTSKTQQQPPLHQAANSKPNIQNQPKSKSKVIQNNQIKIKVSKQTTTPLRSANPSLFPTVNHHAEIEIDANPSPSRSSSKPRPTSWVDENGSTEKRKKKKHLKKV